MCFLKGLNSIYANLLIYDRTTARAQISRLLGESSPGAWGGEDSGQSIFMKWDRQDHELSDEGK